MPVLKNISQLATCPPGANQQDAGLIANAAVVWQGETIRWVGKYVDLPSQYSAEHVADCQRRLVVPGLIDCHTHLCFAGWRAAEFTQRLEGVSYSDIARSGGGIASTVVATRAATQGELLQLVLGRLDAVLNLGVTTVECKSGYGLDETNEIKQLEAINQAGCRHDVDVIGTFLGAHTIPTAQRDNRARYVELLCSTLIPQVSRLKLARFCDVFVDDTAFTIAEARKILDTARSHGLLLKIHADQLSDQGGALLAAELDAVSAEHLEYAAQPGIDAMAQSNDGRGTVAVSLPLASLYLGEPYMDARRFLDAGVRVAVATDFNPGSAPSYHLPLAMTLACLNQSMTPQEVLQGATSVAAGAVGEEGRLGSLLPGYQADIAIMDAPSLDHWLYQFRDNACTATLKKGTWVT